MPKYIALPTGYDLKASECELRGMKWRSHHLLVDFSGPGGADTFRASFEDVVMARLIDNVPIPDKEITKNEGIVPNHLFYEMTDSFFLHGYLGEVVNQTSTRHFRLLTPIVTVDIVTPSMPKFSRISLVQKQK